MKQNSQPEPLSFAADEAEWETEQSRAELESMIPALRAFSRTFFYNSNDADDLVQETLYRALAHLDQYQNGTNMKSWLFTIMRNTFYTKMKVYNRERPAPKDCVSEEPSMLPAQEWRIREEAVLNSVQQLSDEQSEVLILISILGISYIDTAEICDCAIGTVKSRLNRARQRLGEISGEGTNKGMIASDQHHI